MQKTNASDTEIRVRGRTGRWPVYFSGFAHDLARGTHGGTGASWTGEPKWKGTRQVISGWRDCTRRWVKTGHPTHEVAPWSGPSGH